MRQYIQIIEELQRNPLSDPSFRAWFGHSRVVDAEGRPLVVFHGTAGTIDSFRGMVWGSVSPELASTYAEMRDHFAGGGGNVMPLYMRIERPLDADALPQTLTVKDFFVGAVAQAGTVDTGAIAALFQTVQEGRWEEESGPHYSPHDFWYQPRDYFGSKGAAALQQFYSLLGFDGIRYTEHGTLTFGAFSDEQVRSAI